MLDFGLDFGSTSGWEEDGCPRTCCLPLPGLPLLSSGLYWAETGSVWRDGLFCHLNSCPALGYEDRVRGGIQAIVGERLRAPGGAFRVWISCVLKKNLPILDLSVEAIREITGPFLIPDSVQCLFRKIENSQLEQGIIWTHTESCCLSSMPVDNLPFSEV